MTHRPVILAFLVLILLRSRTISLTKDTARVLWNAITIFGPRRDKADPEELDRVLQRVYIDEPDGSKTLLVPYRERIVKV
jgi:ATP-binding cassette subfamily D (ALD) long-chain fatty acid import protein